MDNKQIARACPCATAAFTNGSKKGFIETHMQKQLRENLQADTILTIISVHSLLLSAYNTPWMLKSASQQQT